MESDNACLSVSETKNETGYYTVKVTRPEDEAQTITLTATAKDGYRFINWTKGAEVLSAETSFTYTVPAENVTIVANFEALPTITYELNGGVWNKYGWTSKKDMYDAFIADWKAYSGSTRGTIPYEDQLGIGNSNAGIPTTIQESEDLLGFMAQEKWAWLAQFLDALATEQGKTTKPTEATRQMRYGLGNFFGEDNNGALNWIGAVDCSAGQADAEAFQPTWGHILSNPTQPTTTMVLGDPYRKGYRFDGWTPTPGTMPAENTTFTAQWTEVYKITWYENGVPSYTYVPSDNAVVTWDDNIAEHLTAAGYVIPCFSENFFNSQNCNDELFFGK